MMRTITLAALVLAASVIGLWLVRIQESKRTESSDAGRPVQVSSDAYVSSETCRACHPSEYVSWHASFHRTMTQVATPDTIRPSFDHALVNDVPGNPIQLEQRGRLLWATLNDPDLAASDGRGSSRIERQIVMITGSHQQQAYWYRTGRSRVLGQLPAMYLIDEKRWIPRPAAFMRPPSDGVFSETGRWNGVCINCHATHGKWLFTDGIPGNLSQAEEAETTTAEFGIACEACHGPAADHIRVNENPVRRYLRHLNETDPSIVQPAKLPATRTSEVCGQCHGVWNYYQREDEQRVNLGGFLFRPGDDLRSSRFIVQPSIDHGSSTMTQVLLRDPTLVRDSFWSDGMIRVSGREYNGLIDSPCFRNAADDKKISCSSCHTMHKADDDPRSLQTWADTHQITFGRDGNDACLQCHEKLRANVSGHTRHAADSSGSNCYNCHMPYTTYGLLRALRSHQISSPTVTASVESGRPNACNLCHLDKTLAWTAQYLESWYGTPAVALDRDQQTIAASLLWLLKGDAGQRALAAWSMGWQPARDTSRISTWATPFLIGTLDDPYDAVRFVAFRSLRTLPGMEKLPYDFMSPHDQRVNAVSEALGRWHTGSQAPSTPRPTLLYDVNGELDGNVVQRLVSQRDDRRVSLRE